MGEEGNPRSTVFSRLNPAKREHLKPLSIYSRMTICDQNDRHHEKFADPFINFKIELKNNLARKRKLDSSPDEGYSSCKKSFNPRALSPDLGCFIDDLSPPARQDSLSPSEAVNKTATTESQGSQRLPQNVECRLSTELGAQPVVLNLATAFDGDIDDILALDPVGGNGQNGEAAGPCTRHSMGEVMSCHEEGADEIWNIGPPLFESSLLHSCTVEVVGSEQRREATEEPVPELQATTVTEGDTTYEATLPLQVQVKSVVVAVNHRTTTTTTMTGGKPAAQNRDHQVSQSDRCASRSKSHRPVIFDKEEDWEREKRLYVHSVTRHMKENTGADQDAVTELLSLMSHVADQTPGTNGRQWKHPSDLTRRNYQRRFGNMKPQISLHEWKAKNVATHKRFAKIPKIFERSPFP